MNIAEKIQRIVATGLRQEGWSSPEKLQYMVELIIQREPKTLMEVGIYGGRSFFPMYWASQEYAGATLHGCDPYDADASAVGMEGENLTWWKSLDHNWIYDVFKKEFDTLRPQPFFYKTTGRKVDLHNVDYLHVDGNHSEHEALADVKYWLPRMAKGGVFIFDDCDWPSTRKAVELLEEKCKLLYSMKTTNVANFYEVK